MSEPLRRAAPAKVNLALHVTGRRADGYHLLDSLVMFAGVGDVVHLSRADEISLRVTGPRAAGVPEDASNLCWKAAARFGEGVAITLEKHLPAAAGIGGGSSDAAAVLRGMEHLYGRDCGFDTVTLGADVPVCMGGRAARMAGIGEEITPFDMPALQAVLVNPGVEVPTGAVFSGLERRDNPGLAPLPSGDWLDWIAAQRNDLEAPARAGQPVIGDVLSALGDALLARMSGSGATCFGLYPDAGAAQAAAERIAAAHPDWWVVATELR